MTIKLEGHDVRGCRMDDLIDQTREAREGVVLFNEVPSTWFSLIFVIRVVVAGAWLATILINSDAAPVIRIAKREPMGIGKHILIINPPPNIETKSIPRVYSVDLLSGQSAVDSNLEDKCISGAL
jgi:hypothetical protein